MKRNSFWAHNPRDTWFDSKTRYEGRLWQHIDLNISRPQQRNRVKIWTATEYGSRIQIWAVSETKAFRQGRYDVGERNNKAR